MSNPPPTPALPVTSSRRRSRLIAGALLLTASSFWLSGCLFQDGGSESVGGGVQQEGWHGIDGQCVTKKGSVQVGCGDSKAAWRIVGTSVGPDRPSGAPKTVLTDGQHTTLCKSHSEATAVLWGDNWDDGTSSEDKSARYKILCLVAN
jgi:hypothetical protein